MAENKKDKRSNRDKAFSTKSFPKKHSGKHQSADARISALIESGHIGGIKGLFTPAAMRERNRPENLPVLVTLPIEVTDEDPVDQENAYTSATMPLIPVNPSNGWHLDENSNASSAVSAPKRGLYHIVAVTQLEALNMGQ